MTTLFRRSSAPAAFVGAATMLVAAVATAQPAPAQPLTIRVNARTLQPGEVVVARFAAAPDAANAQVHAFGLTFPAYQSADGVWRALIGIDLEQPPGRYTLEAEAGGRRGRRTITVNAKAFRTRVLKVAPEFVDPPPPVATRIAEEAALLTGVYAASLPERLWRGAFVRPVPGPANSSFGSRSVYNGEMRSPHAGTDFSGAAGTPVKAPNAGRVVLARDLFFTGRTVVIDHGLGVLSILAHLSQIDVEEGESVPLGRVVGLVGATGRVTGPHLHWSLRVGEARVDPLSVMAVVR